MEASAFLIRLAGETVLLLWGVHLVNAGIMRAFGGDLRSVLSRGLGSRLRAFLAGAGVTALLQSSTATAMMVTAFAAGGAVALVPALAVLLGANVGTTLIVQLLSFDISLVYPLVILIGFIAYRRAASRRLHDFGKALLGLGLILLSLHLLTGTAAPLAGSGTFADVLGAVGDDTLFLALVAAVVAWLAHSSAAAVLLVVSFAAAGAIDATAALAMVVGANVGTALNPLLQGTDGDPVKLRAPLGNLVTRLVGAAAALALLPHVVEALGRIEGDPARLVANFHTGFNLVVALVFLPLLTPFAALLRRVLPARLQAADPARPLYLDRRALDAPAVALANAERELLRMADVVQSMLRGSQELLAEDDLPKIAAVRRMDDVLDRLHGAVHRYLAAINDEAMRPEEAKRLAEVAAFAINLEHVGDIVETNLLAIAEKRIAQRVALPEDAKEQLAALHERLIDHLHLAAAVLMSDDVSAARQLVAGKEGFRAMEREAVERHMACMREGGDTAASAIRLDLTRDLKRIEAHIAATAHGVLERSGELMPSRLSPKS